MNSNTTYWRCGKSRCRPLVSALTGDKPVETYKSNIFQCVSAGLHVSKSIMLYPQPHNKGGNHKIDIYKQTISAVYTTEKKTRKSYTTKKRRFFLADHAWWSSIAQKTTTFFIPPILCDHEVKLWRRYYVDCNRINGSCIKVHNLIWAQIIAFYEKFIGSKISKKLSSKFSVSSEKLEAAFIAIQNGLDWEL